MAQHPNRGTYNPVQGYPSNKRRLGCKTIDPTENQKVNQTASTEVWKASRISEKRQEKRELEIPELSGDESRYLSQGRVKFNTKCYNCSSKLRFDISDEQQAARCNLAKL